MNEKLIDQAVEVRAGEEFELSGLSDWLKSTTGKGFSGQLTREQFPSGFSNLTYLLRYRDREFVLRRPPVGSTVKSAHDMHREFRILSSLHPYYAKVPEPILYCEDETVIGAPFYLMERIKGVILRASTSGDVGLNAETMQTLSRSFIKNLVEIHSVDIEAAGLSSFGKPEGYISRQVEGWSRRYINSKTEYLPAVEEVARWLTHNLPNESPATLIHNDYKYDNVVFSDIEAPRLIAVLDWEMATIGDPLMDLGTTLAYWVDSNDPEQWRKIGFGLTALPGNLNRQAILDEYLTQSQREMSDIVFYYVFGLFKISVIVQQISYRFRKGKTHDPRFSNLGELVQAAGN